MEIRILDQESNVNTGCRGKAQIPKNKPYGSNLGGAKGGSLCGLKKPDSEEP